MSNLTVLLSKLTECITCVAGHGKVKNRMWGRYQRTSVKYR